MHHVDQRGFGSCNRSTRACSIRHVQVCRNVYQPQSDFVLQELAERPDSSFNKELVRLGLMCFHFWAVRTSNPTTGSLSVQCAHKTTPQCACLQVSPEQGFDAFSLCPFDTCGPAKPAFCIRSNRSSINNIHSAGFLPWDPASLPRSSGC